MAYPRVSPLCRAPYGESGAVDLGHVTLAAEAGGTPSPWRPELPGRLLTLDRRHCGGSYRWGYFADAGAYLRPPGQTLAVLDACERVPGSGAAGRLDGDAPAMRRAIGAVEGGQRGREAPARR